VLALCGLPCCVIAFTGFGARDAGGRGGAETAGGPGFYRDRAGENTRPPEPPAEKTGPEFDGRELLRVSGKVRLVGSAALSSLVISGEQGEWYVEGGERDKLMELQQRDVTVEGRPDSEEIILANGRRLGRRLILRDVRIIDSAS
jgi:hypothetical protein